MWERGREGRGWERGREGRGWERVGKGEKGGREGESGRMKGEWEDELAAEPNRAALNFL